MSYQAKLIKKKEAEGYLVLKTIRLNKSGYPDLILLKDGITTFIEVKEGNDFLSPLQKHRIDELRSKSFNAYCLHETKGKIY